MSMTMVRKYKMVFIKYVKVLKNLGFHHIVYVKTYNMNRKVFLCISWRNKNNYQRRLKQHTYNEVKERGIVT